METLENVFSNSLYSTIFLLNIFLVAPILLYVIIRNMYEGIRKKKISNNKTYYENKASDLEHEVISISEMLRKIKKYEEEIDNINDLSESPNYNKIFKNSVTVIVNSAKDVKNVLVKINKNDEEPVS